MSQFSKFCLGCGQPITLNTLYRILKKNGDEKKAVLGLDIGCSLLAWDMLPINTFQTHHGRVTSTMTGFKRAKKDLLSFAFTGDGGAYAIGLQPLLWAAKRNEPISVIVSNNVVYAMTGGQSAPTTLEGQKTSTTPSGKNEDVFFGPELVRKLNDKAYIARVSCNDMKSLQEALEKSIEAQKAGNFSLVEVLSYCPTAWKTKGIETNQYLENNLKQAFVLGEF